MKIREGDLVSVNFNNSRSTLSHEAVVNHVPKATGDSWVFTDLNNGSVHYVSEGCTVTKWVKQS